MAYQYICDLTKDKESISVMLIKRWCDNFSIPYPLDISPALYDWCNENLSGEWYYYFKIDIQPNKMVIDNIVFWFEEESDIVGFKLMWES